MKKNSFIVKLSESYKKFQEKSNKLIPKLKEVSCLSYYFK